MIESQIQDAVRLALGRDPDVCVWRNNCGALQDARGRFIRFGVASPGGADLIGMFRGRFLAIEIKTATGRQTEDQVRFQKLVESRGGIYLLVRSAEDAVAQISALKGNA